MRLGNTEVQVFCYASPSRFNKESAYLCRKTQEPTFRLCGWWNSWHPISVQSSIRGVEGCFSGVLIHPNFQAARHTTRSCPGGQKTLPAKGVAAGGRAPKSLGLKGYRWGNGVLYKGWLWGGLGFGIPRCLG